MEDCPLSRLKALSIPFPVFDFVKCIFGDYNGAPGAWNGGGVR